MSTARSGRPEPVAPATPFTLDVAQRGAVATLVARGELDLLHTDWLDSELDRTSTLPIVVLDLRDLRFIDSHGLLTLVRAHRRIESRGGRFVVVVADNAVRRVLRLTGLEARLNLIEQDGSFPAPSQGTRQGSSSTVVP